MFKSSDLDRTNNFTNYLYPLQKAGNQVENEFRKNKIIEWISLSVYDLFCLLHIMKCMIYCVFLVTNELVFGTNTRAQWESCMLFLCLHLSLLSLVHFCISVSSNFRMEFLLLWGLCLLGMCSGHLHYTHDCVSFKCCDQKHETKLGSYHKTIPSTAYICRIYPLYKIIYLHKVIKGKKLSMSIW